MSNSRMFFVLEKRLKDIDKVMLIFQVFESLILEQLVKLI